MTSCLIVGLCAFTLLSMCRAAFWRHRAYVAQGGFGGGHGGGCGPRFGGGRGGKRWGRWGGRAGLGSEQVARAAGEVLKRKLDIDDEQEPIVDHALGDLHAAVKELKAEFSATHAPLAEALRGEKLDDGALAAIFARHDDALARARREIVSAVKQIHAVLDKDQRSKAADSLAAMGAAMGADGKGEKG